MTKKILAVISGIISIILLLINYIGTYKICANVFECTEILFASMMILFPIIPLFIFSLITFKMREDIFQSWWKFARVWVPLSMIAVLLAPSNTSNWMFPIEKGSVAFFSSAIFVIVSIFLIAHKQYSLRKK